MSLKETFTQQQQQEEQRKQKHLFDLQMYFDWLLWQELQSRCAQPQSFSAIVQHLFAEDSQHLLRGLDSELLLQLCSEQNEQRLEYSLTSEFAASEVDALLHARANELEAQIAALPDEQRILATGAALEVYQRLLAHKLELHGAGGERSTRSQRAAWLREDLQAFSAHSEALKSYPATTVKAMEDFQNAVNDYYQPPNGDLAASLQQRFYNKEQSVFAEVRVQTQSGNTHAVAVVISADGQSLTVINRGADNQLINGTTEEVCPVRQFTLTGTPPSGQQLAALADLFAKEEQQSGVETLYQHLANMGYQYDAGKTAQLNQQVALQPQRANTCGYANPSAALQLCLVQNGISAAEAQKCQQDFSDHTRQQTLQLANSLRENGSPAMQSMCKTMLQAANGEQPVTSTPRANKL